MNHPIHPKIKLLYKNSKVVVYLRMRSFSVVARIIDLDNIGAGGKNRE